MPPETGPETLRFRTDIGPVTVVDETDQVEAPRNTTDENHLRLFEIGDSGDTTTRDLADLLMNNFPGSVLEDEVEGYSAF